MLIMICLTTSVGALRLCPISIHPSTNLIQGPSNLLDQTLVDSHLESVPGLGTLSAGRLSGGDLQSLGGETDGTLDAEILALGTLDELLADLLKGGDLSAGEGDTDLVGFLRLVSSFSIPALGREMYWALAAELLVGILLVRHGNCRYLTTRMFEVVSKSCKVMRTGWLSCCLRR
jgi:hypothetical protein